MRDLTDPSLGTTAPSDGPIRRIIGRWAASPEMRWLILGIGVSALIGISAMLAPVPTTLLGILAFVLSIVLAARWSAARVFLVALAFLLVGYAFFGRGIAYLGVGVAYVGEIGLGLSVIAFLVALRRAHFGALHGLLLIYMAWGLIRTVPYLGDYGVDALRDAVTWIYGFIALALSVVVQERHFPRLVGWYRRGLPLFLLWVPIAFLLTTLPLPTAPGSDVPIIVFKGGDYGVHLAGAAAFTLLGLAASPGFTGQLRQAALWLVWLVDVAIVGGVNRGGLVAAAAATVTLLFQRVSARWFGFVFAAVVVATGAALLNPEVDTGGQRKLSAQQLIDNITSIYSSDVGSDVLQGSKDFRLRWWSEIVDYTVGGPYFWLGKGFGINLADDDGFQTDGTLRAPHNGHMTILAREGVPGFLIWVLLQVSFGWGLLRAGLRAHAEGRTFWAQIAGWIFAYWFAALLNMSFDPYLEGPQGGIWFWSAFGLGLAAMATPALRRPDPAGALSDRPATGARGA
jgi:hypothetical protein